MTKLRFLKPQQLRWLNLSLPELWSLSSAAGGCCYPSLNLFCGRFVYLQIHGISRNLRKVNLLLQAFESAGKKVDYYALDLSREELERTLAQLPAYEHVCAHGLLGTYDDGREWLKRSSITSRQKCILSLGSSIGMLISALPCPTLCLV